MIKKLEKMRIQQRLTKSSLLTVGIASVAAIIATIFLFFISSMYNRTLTYYAFPQGDLGIAIHELADIRGATRGAIGYNDTDLIAQMIEQHDQAVEDLYERMEIIEKTIVTDDGQQSYDAILEALDAYLEIDAKVLELGATMNETLSRQAQNMAVEEMAPAYEKAHEEFEHFMEMNVELGDGTQSQLNVLRVLLCVIIAIIIAVACTVATKIGTIIANGIANPLHELSDRLEHFAQGDIRSAFPDYHNEDAVGEIINSVKCTTEKLSKIFDDLEHLLGEMANGNFNLRTSCEEEYVGDYKSLLLAIREMNRQMDATLKEVRADSEMVSAGASNLAEASQALAEGATEQAASVEELQASINEITYALEQSAEEGNRTYKEAERVATIAEESRTEMGVMTEAMSRINDTSLKIGSVITEIEDIASQTNLLSLNASIEAARAGEAGRGFAVVADQIRTLAEQSAKAAVNTRELIEGSIHEITIGNETAEKTANTLVQVVEAIHVIAEVTKEQSEKTKQQAESIEQADAGIARISEVVQANSAAAQEASATSEELSAQAANMDDLVGKFILRE